MKKKVFSFNFCVLSVFFLHCGEKCRNLRLIQNVFEDQKDIMYSWKQSTYLKNIYQNELIEYIPAGNHFDYILQIVFMAIGLEGVQLN